MKKLLSASMLALSMVLVPLASSAAYNAGDDWGEGHNNNYPTADGRYHGGDRYDRPMHVSTRYPYFVCYRSSVTFSNRFGELRKHYRGCYTSTRNCPNSRTYFGGYDDRSSQMDAFDRCVNNAPRFIDN